MCPSRSPCPSARRSTPMDALWSVVLASTGQPRDLLGPVRGGGRPPRPSRSVTGSIPEGRLPARRRVSRHSGRGCPHAFVRLASRARNGTATRTVVPRPGWLSSSNVPLSCRARSRMLTSPSRPSPTCLGSRPRPSSAIVEDDVAAGASAAALDASGRRVLRRVPERLLCDPVDGEGGARATGRPRSLDFAGDSDPVGVAERLAVARSTSGRPACFRSGD